MSATAGQGTQQRPSGLSRFFLLPLAARIIVLLLSVSGVFLFIYYVFNITVMGLILETSLYYYLLWITFGTTIFLLLPARKKDADKLPWYDCVLAFLVFITSCYCASNAMDIARGKPWVPAPNLTAAAAAWVISLISFESGRRVGGWPIVGISVLFGAYPLFAEYMPGVLYGIGSSVNKIVSAFAYGAGGLRGLPTQVTGNILIGYMLFAGFLAGSGAGNFFLKFSLALLGRIRGGPAQVAVVASALFGMLSGSPMANVVATGSITIPAMKRTGYPPHYAGAIQAVAGNGGMIMPPIMGSIIFLMVILTQIPYSTVVLAAFIPAIFYYLGLMIQVDAYAAKTGMHGLPREELPSLRESVKDGWQFFLVLAFLIFALIYMQWDVTAPVYATALLLIMMLMSGVLKRPALSGFRERLNGQIFLQAFISSVETVVFMMAVLMPLGFLMIGLDITGTFTAITAELVYLGQDNAIAVLIIAALICYLLGFVGIQLPPYLVIAVLAVPGIVKATGLSTIGIHLFIIYYLITGGVTPPVAVIAFVAASMAGASPMKTAWTATRLAIVVYFVPFFFVFNPALLFEGPLTDTLMYFVFGAIGIWILASGLEGYMMGVGALPLWSRPLLFIGGLLFAFPEWRTTVIGVVLTIAIVVSVILASKGRQKATGTCS
jgi:TRAP transporter 4TM/12TM fusion protein